VHARGTTQSRARDHTFTAQAAAGPMEQQQCGHRPPLCLCGCALLRHTCVTRAHAATRPMRALVVLAALRSATAPTRVPSPTALAGLDPAAIRARVSSCGNFGVGDVHTWLRPERLVALANAGDEEGCVYGCALHRTYPRPGMGAAPQPDSTSRAACLQMLGLRPPVRSHGIPGIQIPPYVRAEDLRCIPGVLRVVAHPTERSGSRRLVIRASEVEDGPEGEIGFTADALVFLALGLSQPHWNGREFLDPDVMVWSSAGKERAEAAIATKCGGGPACRADFMRVLALKFSPRLGGARGATATVAATPSATALTGGDIAAKVDECGTVVWGEVTETSDELVQRFLGHMRGDRDELTVAYSVCAV
jgi:hypothetical protein